MNCQAGDTAIVVKPGNDCNNIGRMVLVKQWMPYPTIGQDGHIWLGGGWLCTTLWYGLRTPCGTVSERLFDDSMLMPMRWQRAVRQVKAARLIAVST